MKLSEILQNDRVDLVRISKILDEISAEAAKNNVTIKIGQHYLRQDETEKMLGYHKNLLQEFSDKLDHDGKLVLDNKNSLDVEFYSTGSFTFRWPFSYDSKFDSLSISSLDEHGNHFVTIDEELPECRNFSGTGIDLKDYRYLKLINSVLFHADNKVPNNVLSLLKLPRLEYFYIEDNIDYSSPDADQEVADLPDYVKALKIIAKHAGKDHDVAEAIEELHDAGLEEFAKL